MVSVAGRTTSAELVGARARFSTCNPDGDARGREGAKSSQPAAGRGGVKARACVHVTFEAGRRSGTGQTVRAPKSRQVFARRAAPTCQSTWAFAAKARMGFQEREISET